MSSPIIAYSPTSLSTNPRVQNNTTPQHQGSAIDKAQQQVQTLLSRASQKLPNMAQIQRGLGSAIKRIDKLVHNNPVLSMSLGIAGAIAGGGLFVAQPIAGVALLSLSSYLIVRSLKPVLQRLATCWNSARNNSTTRSEHLDGTASNSDPLPVTPTSELADTLNTNNSSTSTEAPISPLLEPETEAVPEAVTEPESAPNPALNTNNLHTVLEALQEHNPRARLALVEALARSKELLPRRQPDPSTHDVLAQFVRAKALHQLPSAEAVLQSLDITSPTNQNPESVKALATLIDRHAPALIQTVLDQPYTPDDQLQELGEYFNTLVQHTTAVSNPFWEHSFHPETTVQFLALVRRMLDRAKTIRNHIQNSAIQLQIAHPNLDFSAENNRRINVAQNLDNTVITTFSWVEKAHYLKTIKEKTNTLPYLGENERADRDIVLAAVQQNGRALQHASEDLRADRDIVLAAVQQNGRALQLASEDLRADPDIVLAAVQQDGGALLCASEILRTDRDIVMAAVQQDGRALEYASENLRADHDIVLTAVQKNGWALLHASEDLRADRDIVLAAVQQKGRALRVANPTLRNDRNIVLAAVQQNGLALEFAHLDLRNTPEIVQAAVQQDGWALQFAHQDLRADRDIVLAAVKKYGEALKFASEDLRADRDIVLTAVQQSQERRLALKYAHQDLRADRDIVLAAVKKYGDALKFASEDLRADRDIVLAAVQQYGWALEFAHQDLRADRDIVLAAVKNGDALQFASEELRADRDIVLAAVQKNVGAFAFASEDLQADPEIRRAVGLLN